MNAKAQFSGSRGGGKAKKKKRAKGVENAGRDISKLSKPQGSYRSKRGGRKKASEKKS